MLVLSRKEGERLVIDGNITVVVTKVSGNRVTLGIEAPRDVRVMRGEIVDQLHARTEMTIDLSELIHDSNIPAGAI